MRIVYVGAGTGENPWLRDAAEECRKRGLPVEVVSVASEVLDSEEKAFVGIIEEIGKCDLLVVSNHGSSTYFKKFDRLVAAARDNAVTTFIGSSVPEEMNDFRNLFSYPDGEYDFVHACTELGGKKNTTSLLLWACRTISGFDIEVPPLEYPPTEGFYHPSIPDIHDPATHMERIDPARPTVGILFHQFFFVRRNLRAIDALIAAVEDKDMNALAFFLVTSPSEVTGAMGIRRFVEQYLIKDRTPVIDVLVVTMSFSQVSLSDPNDGRKAGSFHNFFDDLNVPVLQTICMYRSLDQWQADDSGLSAMEISSGVIWPEFDGQIIAIPLATTEKCGERTGVQVPVPRRPERIADMALQWARLRRTPPEDRKVAILLYQYTSEIEALGDAGGLDTPQSVVGILQRLRDEGYRVDHVPKDGNALIAEMVAGLTNDTRWISGDEMKKRAAGLVPGDLYKDWFRRIPGKNRDEMCRDWGEPPGQLFEREGDLCIPGIVNGNVFIGIQPPRGFFEQVESLVHSSDLVIPHNYLAYYRWMRDVFGAHVIIHMGTHGTLEWLPGKGNAMSEECYPDVVLEDMPDVYPYIINDPGECVQAKRRGWGAVIDHMVPAMMRAEGYGKLSELDGILQEYLRAKQGKEEQKAKDLIGEVHRFVIDLDLTSDLGLPADAGEEEVARNAERLCDYLCEVRDVIIKDGLHVFGRPPEGDRLCEMVYALTRLSNGNVPSLREGVAEALSLSLSGLLDNPSGFNEVRGKTNSALVDEIDARTRDLVGRLAECGFDRERALAVVRKELGTDRARLETCIEFICDDLVPRIRRTTDEIENMIRSLNGGYVPPGPSGDPTRGNAHLLPTGRNCYSIDPATIPTPAAWQTGKKMADQMVERYIREKGKYPERVGIVVWATDTMRTGGDDIAYLLWLMGLSPVWSDRSGTVTGLRVIPAGELGRPRIDVTLRISGLFRDTFPHLVTMIDGGVETIASLDESDEVNFLAAHLRQDMIDKVREGLPVEKAREMALIRIFGDPPGNHGCAVGEVVHASAWRDRKDLADVYTTWGAHAYGRRFRGEKVTDLFRQQFSRLDATVKNRVSREFDILDVDDDYIFLGGMNACVKAYGNKDPVSVIGEASDPGVPKTRLLEEEVRFVYRSRVLNPRWIEGLKPHGFRGVQEVMNTIEYTYGWDVTSDAVDDWEYQAAAEHFLFNEENRKWIEENNPYALHNMAGRLLEAIERGFWKADDETIRRLQEIYLESEDTFERMGGTLDE